MKRDKQVKTRRKSIPCDYKALEDLLIEKGSSFPKASEEFGYADNYLRNLQIENKELPVTTSVMLKALFGIDEKAYAPKPQRRNNNDLNIKELTGRELYALIYGAVYQANMKAYEEKRKLYAFEKRK